jgi:lipopolysaccharide/colanic/teichoic acid biosynthesis glycosyltransferase
MSSGEPRAVIMATGTVWEGVGGELVENRVFLDRSFGQHVIEALVAHGIRKVDMVVYHRPEAIEAAWGDGSRWGIQIDYHLARDGKEPFRALRGLDLGREGVLLGRADLLPNQESIQALSASRGRMALMVSELGETSGIATTSWAGWAWIPPLDTKELPTHGDSASLEDWIGRKGHGEGRRASVTLDSGEYLDVRSPEAFLDSMQLVLDGGFENMLKTGRQVRPGVRMGKNAKVHPSVVITAPAHLGENCWIGPGARIGPFASIGRGSMVGKGSTVVRSDVGLGSYVGDGLSLEGALVDKNRLIDTSLGVTVELKDQLLLGSVTKDKGGTGWASACSRGLALVALTAFSPMLLVTAAVLKLVRPGPVLFRKEVLRPSSEQEGTGERTIRLFSFDPSFGTGSERMAGRSSRLQDVVLRFLPGLVNVAKGEVRVVGLEPRSSKNLAALPEEWQGVYRGSDIGLVTEAEVRLGPGLDPDSLFAAEAYYSALRSPGHKLKLLLAYLMGRGRKRAPVLGAQLPSS